MLINRVGPPVRGDDFFGRDAFMELVWQKIEAGHVLLAAPRRFGKTSVMYRLMDQPRGDYKIIHADLEHFIEPVELISELILKMAKDDQLSKISNSLSYFPKKLWGRFRSNFEEVALLQLKIKLREQLSSQWREKGDEFFHKVAASEQPILFILDEFPMMIDRMAQSETHREEAKTLLRWLRALRVSPEMKNIRFLIAGSIGIGYVLNELGDIATINDFEQLRLEPFSPRIATEFLQELSKTANLALSQPSQRKILDLIGTRVPYFIQILFSEIVKAYTQDGEAITPRKIEEIYHEKVLGVDCKTYFDHYYGRLRDYYEPQEERAIKRLLRELAMAGSLTRDASYSFYRLEMGGPADIEQFNYLMTNLENDFYIRFHTASNSYEFSCKLLRDWWLRHYAMHISLEH
ncbi:MAG: hypothetical protein JO316_00240 [Abitibacteriaceae bacterium]|nr:hypothetical protein [Abditibacteriaceae bacterium]MBV9863754.1 hypothetical protein [Abditibacteriaceae bacterium]